MPPRPDLEERLVAGRAYNEDAAVLSVPPGYAIVQTVDVLAPIVNDGYAFGRIAAANALSDVYAMGGDPWCAMSLAFFPPELASSENDHTITAILQGSMDVMLEAGAISAGGHTVQDDELKYGLSVTGIIRPDRIARNDGLRPGQILVLTKPLGSGILATGVKAHWENADESEREIVVWCGKLNKGGGRVIQKLALTGATDITGFGLGGHAMEMAHASGVCVAIRLGDLPIMPHALEYARDGLIPAGTHANAAYCKNVTRIAAGADEALVSVVFDAQTSGGLLLAIPPEKLNEAFDILGEFGDLAAVIGEVREKGADGKELVLE